MCAEPGVSLVSASFFFPPAVAAGSPGDLLHQPAAAAQIGGAVQMADAVRCLHTAIRRTETHAKTTFPHSTGGCRHPPYARIVHSTLAYSLYTPYIRHLMPGRGVEQREHLHQGQGAERGGTQTLLHFFFPGLWLSAQTPRIFASHYTGEGRVLRA